MSQTKKEMQKHLEARKTIYDLSCHPALPDPVFTVQQLMCLDIAQVCKHGYTEPIKGCLDIRNTPQNYKRFKKEFDNEFKEYTPAELDLERGLIRVKIPYETIYGKKWKPDHIEYWGELSFCVFIGKDYKKWIELSNWERYAGISATGKTWEETITKLGRKFFKAYGKFNEENFLTPTEKKNHKKEFIFLTKPAKKQGCRGSYLIHNPKHILIHASEINRRWLKWFAKTEEGKEKWNSFKDILTNS
jgi:hypothetical protein